MALCTAKQRVALGKKIREGKDKHFPGRGGCIRLARELGISPQLLSHWMNGNRVPDSGRLVALAKFFNISILELCSLPKIRGKGKLISAYDIIDDISKAHRKTGTSRKNRKMLNDANTMINAFIKKELGDLQS